MIKRLSRKVVSATAKPAGLPTGNMKAPAGAISPESMRTDLQLFATTNGESWETSPSQKMVELPQWFHKGLEELRFGKVHGGIILLADENPYYRVYIAHLKQVYFFHTNEVRFI